MRNLIESKFDELKKLLIDNIKIPYFFGDLHPYPYVHNPDDYEGILCEVKKITNDGYVEIKTDYEEVEHYPLSSLWIDELKTIYTIQQKNENE